MESAGTNQEGHSSGASAVGDGRSCAEHVGHV